MIFASHSPNGDSVCDAGIDINGLAWCRFRVVMMQKQWIARFVSVEVGKSV